MRHVRRRKPKVANSTRKDAPLANRTQVRELQAETIRFCMETLGLSRAAAEQEADIVGDIYSKPPSR